MSTKRVAAAAAGIGVTLATLTGATTAFGSPTPRPNIVVPGAGVTVTSGTPISFPQNTLRGGNDTPLQVPNFTINDPGIITSGSQITVALSGPTGVAFDDSHTPRVTVNGNGVIVTQNPTISNDGSSFSFTVGKTDTTTNATYALSNVYIQGTAATVQGQVGATVTYTDKNKPGTNTVRTFPFGAVTNLLPAVYGPTAADTAATLFRAAVDSDSDTDSLVLATDYAPQDAESASYLASALGTGIALTNRTTLSPAVSDILDDYDNIDTVYVVGGVNVVSQSIVNTLEKRNLNVVRLAGDTAYQTNQTVVNFANQNGNDNNDDNGDGDISIDYSSTRYNTTSGSSSPTTTGTVSGATAIVASGDIRSFSDGIASGPISYKDGVPLFLTSPGSLDSGVRQLLISGDYDQVILLGGPAAVSNRVYDQLSTTVDKGGAGVNVFRIAGATASETASLLASFETQAGTGLNFNINDQGNTINNPGQGTPTDNTAGGVLIARGTGFQDALAAGPYAGDEGNTPILLTNSATDLGAPLGAYLRGVGAAGFFTVQALGGPLSVSAAVQQAAINATVSGIPTTK